MDMLPSVLFTMDNLDLYAIFEVQGFAFCLSVLLSLWRIALAPVLRDCRKLHSHSEPNVREAPYLPQWLIQLDQSNTLCSP